MIKRLYFAALLILMTTANVSNAGGGIKRSGDILAVGLPVIAAGLSYAHGDTNGLWQLMESEATTVLLVEVLKSSTHEMRPNGKDDKSFPSGHAAVAFSAAQYLQMRGGWEYGVPAYVLATAVGYSRVRSNEHYWKDVVAGAMLGASASYYFTTSLPSTRFGLALTPNSAYIQLARKW
jgi:membrane-associated phospholipid phosphatase